MSKKNNDTKEMTIAQVIKKRKSDLAVKRGYAELIIRIILILLVGYLIFTQVFIITQVHGMGMFPAVKDGDLVIAFRLQKDYQKNDVVVYEKDGRISINRIVAMQNDIVQMDNKGDLLINGTTKTGEIMFPSYSKEAIKYPYCVSHNSVFVLGDYRTIAVDSRDYGELNVDEIEGKVITIFRRRGI